MKIHEKMINEARLIAKSSFEKYSKLMDKDINELKNKVRIETEKFLFKKLQREPMVLAVVIKV